MPDRLLPPRADNGYHGSRLALWIFGLVVLVKTGISLGVMFNGHAAATEADGIPLDSFSPAAAQTLLSLFALLGVAQFLICLLCILVLVRYRALVPLMLVVLLLYQSGRYLVLYLLPIARAGAPPGSIINLALLGLLIAGVALSLGRGKAPHGHPG